MALKERSESLELQVLRILNALMELSSDDKQYYHYLKQGYEGEVMFDKFTEKLQCDCLILNDLLLEVNHSEFQIDTLLIIQNKIHLFDVKNSEGDHIYKDGNIVKVNGTVDRKNPLHQLERCVSLLRQWLKKLGYHYPVESLLIYINPEFSLYQVSSDLPLVLPTQVSRLMKKLDNSLSKLTNRHHELARDLLAAHKPYRNTNLPNYEYHQLTKKVTCCSCCSLSVDVGQRKLVCSVCGCEETVDSAILRKVEEIRLLFPEMKLTTNLVFEWCGGEIYPKRKIQRSLSSSFKRMGQGKYSYFIPK